MMRKLMLVLSLLFAHGVMAAGANGLDYNLVRLDASATVEVKNDQMRVDLAVEHNARDAGTLPDLVNTDMRWALDAAAKRPAVRAQTGEYSTQPEYASTRIVGWRAVQELRIEGEDFAAVSALVTELQQKLQVRSMSFVPTRATRQKAEADLTREALKAFAERAKLIAESMGAKGYEVVDVNVGSAPEPVLYRTRGVNMMAMSADAAPAPVAVESGTASITVSVNGQIQLR
jgi:predicted secreted protein